MKFSIFSLLHWSDDPSQGEFFQRELEQLTRAESQGYHCAWLAEHPNSRHGMSPAIHLAAANLAARTETIRLGSAITIHRFMHPLRIAEEVAMLDILAEGRIEWAVERGEPGAEAQASGIDVEQSHEMFTEQLEVIQSAWKGVPFAHAGAFYNFDELRCFPPPIQESGPTIHIAARSEESIKWAARYHYPVLSDSLAPAGRLEADRRIYIEAAAAVGVDASTTEYPIVRQVYVGETMKKAREEAAPALLGCNRSLAREIPLEQKQHQETPDHDSRFSILGEEAFNPNEDPEGFLKFLFDECSIVGDAAYCRDRIAELQETLKLAELVAWQNFGDLSQEQTLASQERLMTEVAPAFA